MSFGSVSVISTGHELQLATDHTSRIASVGLSAEGKTKIQNIFMAVMGVTGSGKSSFIKLCSQTEVNVGHGLQACELPFKKISLQNFLQRIQ